MKPTNARVEAGSAMADLETERPLHGSSSWLL
jgi:hypothetical protein